MLFERISWKSAPARYPGILAAFLLAAIFPWSPALAGDPARYGLGWAATPEQIAGWDIDVRADGKGLPPGSGGVEAGKAIYAQTCAACHGERGEGKPMDRLVGGFGTLATAHPVKTVGSYWPYATTLFDFVRRAMPSNAPQSLTPDQVYAVCAYILYLNGIVGENTVLGAESLPRVAMPNRNGFTSPDPRPDVHKE
jgi:cytochrome c